VLLQLGLAIARGEALTKAQKRVVVSAARVLAAPEITREDSRRVGRLMREAGFDVLQVADAALEAEALAREQS
jgi:predicted transposase YdaD